MTKQTFVYAAGGTAGHIYPAQGLAEQALQHRHILITDQRGSLYANKDIFDEIITTPLKRTKLLRNVWQTVAIVRQCFKNPTISGLFVLGGYTSIIPALIAYFKKIPIFVIETNSIMGKANKLAAKLSKNIFTTFDLSKNYPHSEQVGFLVRKDIKPATQQVHDNFNILVLGSSIGGYFFAHNLPKALEKLPLEIRQKLNITQHSPKNLHQELSEFYNKNNIKYELYDFVENIQQEMEKADLIICRAGASTISEACVIGRFMILVPYKLAAEDHQTKNAKIIENAKYAKLITEDNFSSKSTSDYLYKNILEKHKLPKLSISKNGCQNIWEKIDKNN